MTDWLMWWIIAITFATPAMWYCAAMAFRHKIRKLSIVVRNKVSDVVSWWASRGAPIPTRRDQT